MTIQAHPDDIERYGRDILCRIIRIEEKIQQLENWELARYPYGDPHIPSDERMELEGELEAAWIEAQKYRDKQE